MMSSGNGDSLVDMIIGKPVKDAEDQRYVRNTDQDIVYVVKLDPAGLSTDFDDWIEGDLLKINPFDIRQVHIKDYSAEFMMTLQGPRVQYDQRGDFSLVYDNSNSKWSAESLLRYDVAAKKFIDDPLSENQELNSDALQGLRDGLDDLRIVDVERKPEGLSADLKAGGDFLKNEAAGSLIPRGFAPVSLSPNGPAEILSSEGELTCTLQDGVEYVLRFGNLKIDGEGNTSSDNQAKSANDSAVDSDASSESDQGIHRYLFVTTRFNADVLEKPEDQPLPPLPQGVESEEAIEQQEENADAEKKNEEEPDESTDGELTASTQAASEDKGEDAETENSEQSPDDKATDLKEIVAQRKSIRAENQRHQDEYDQKIEDGNKRVQELNERFGDWYYVIANDVYKKIHLDRDQLVREKKEEDDKSPASPAGNPSMGLQGTPPMGIPPGHPPIRPAAKPVEESNKTLQQAPVKEAPKAEKSDVETPNAGESEKKPAENAAGTPAETVTEESTEASQDSVEGPPAESDTEETSTAP